MSINSAPATPLPVIEAIGRGERKKAVLVEALRASPITRESVDGFISAMNSIQSPVAAQLIAMAWPSMDSECRTQISRSWLDGKEKEQQAGGYHTLAARILVHDPEASMFFLDRVAKLAAGSPPCRKRVISTTRAEWVGTTPEGCGIRTLDPSLLAIGDRVVLLEWLCESCQLESQPSGNERRRSQLQKEAQARASVVGAWLEQIKGHQNAPAVTAVLAQCLQKLRPKEADGEVLLSAETRRDLRSATQAAQDQFLTTDPAAAAAAPNALGAHPSEPTTRTSGEDADMLHDAFNAIRQLFQKENGRHRRAIHALEGELAAAQALREQAKRDGDEYRAANKVAAEHVTALEEQVQKLVEAREIGDRELVDTRGRVAKLTQELDAKQRECESVRHESHEAIHRETQRERERLLGHLGRQIQTIVESYRELRSRGTLPDGVPRMIGEMMDELVARLEHEGMRFTRDR